MEYEFTAELWEWQGAGAWCFVTVPKEISSEIKQISSGIKKGFGSVRVEVSCGSSNWQTSIFPDSKSGSYLLPVKKQIRTKEQINLGESTIYKIVLRDF